MHDNSQGPGDKQRSMFGAPVLAGLSLSPLGVYYDSVQCPYLVTLPQEMSRLRSGEVPSFPRASELLYLAALVEFDHMCHLVFLN